jgi:integrase
MGMTIREFIAERYAPVALAPLVWSWRKAVGRHLDQVARDFPGELSELRAEVVERWWAELPPEWGPRYRNMHLEALRGVCRAAVRWGYLDRDPTEGIKPLRVSNGRVRWFTYEEWGRLLTGASPALRLYILGAYYLGARQATLRAMKVKDVDLSRDLVRIRHLKGKPEGAVKPLHSRLRAALEPRIAGADPEAPLFPPLRDDSISHGFSDLAKRLGIRDATFHDLRHHAGTMLAAAGVTQAAIRDHLNHSTLAASSRYVHMPPEVMRAVIDKL